MSGWNEHFPSLMLLAGTVLLAWILLRCTLRSLRRTRRLANQASPRTSPDHQSQRPAADAPPEVLRWQVEMHETARDLLAELDSKAGVLQYLIRQATCERERLEAAIAGAQRHGGSRGCDTLAEIEQSTYGDGDCQTSAGSEWLPKNLPPASAAACGQLAAADPPSVEIERLARRGLDPSSIATRLGLPIGEVEILLGLRSSQSRTNRP